MLWNKNAIGEQIPICLDKENGEEAIQPQQQVPAVVVPENAQDSNLRNAETSPVMNEHRETIADSCVPRARRSPAWMTVNEVKGIDQSEDPRTHFAHFSDCDPINFESSVKDEKW